MSEFVNIKDKTVYIPNNDVIVEEIEKYMGHDFSEFIRKHFEAYEAEKWTFQRCFKWNTINCSAISVQRGV